MRVNGASPLAEGVIIKNPAHMMAYAICVAEAYEAAPRHDPAADRLWTLLKRHNADKLFRRLHGTGIQVAYTPDDPYSKYTNDPAMMVRFMLFDMVVRNRLLIYSGHSDDHPNFSAEENVIFRTVHDYFTHGKLFATFKRNLLKVAPEMVKGRDPTPEQLLRVLPHVSLATGGNLGHEFTLRGELNAAMTHIRLAPKAVAPALFTEVAGQVCYNVICGHFPQQKVAVLPGFDYFNIGRVLPGTVASDCMTDLFHQITQAKPTDVIKMHLRTKPEITVAALRSAFR